MAAEVWRESDEGLPDISLGTWTYLFQGLLVCILFGVRRNIHIP